MHMQRPFVIKNMFSLPEKLDFIMDFTLISVSVECVHKLFKHHLQKGPFFYFTNGRYTS